MSTLTLAVVALVLLIGPALVVIVLDAGDIWGTESYTISTRDLPNTAPDLTGTADRTPGMSRDTSTGTRP
jgi:hypothetical protein